MYLRYHFFISMLVVLLVLFHPSSGFSNDSGGAWKVSWKNNPGGSDAFESGPGAGHSGNLRRGPRQPDRAVEDAQAGILAEYQTGTSADDPLIRRRERLESARVKMSHQVRDQLDRIGNPGMPRSSFGTENYLYIIGKMYQKIDRDRQSGHQTTAADLAFEISKQVVSQKLKTSSPLLGDAVDSVMDRIIRIPDGPTE